MSMDKIAIEKLRKINRVDEFIGCLMEHVLRRDA